MSVSQEKLEELKQKVENREKLTKEEVEQLAEYMNTVCTLPKGACMCQDKNTNELILDTTKCNAVEAEYYLAMVETDVREDISNIKDVCNGSYYKQE